MPLHYRGNHVVLLPIHAAWKMRPKMDYLTEAPAASSAAKDKAEKEKAADADAEFIPQVSLLAVDTIFCAAKGSGHAAR